MKLAITVLLCVGSAFAQAGLSGNASLTGNGTIQTMPTPTIPPANFYVATTGSDTNPGTLVAPFLTLDRARVAAQSLSCTAPHLVYLRAGSYYNSSTTFSSADSAASGCPMTYSNFPGEYVILSGGLRITGWSVVTGGTCATATTNGYTCYQTTIPNTSAYFEQLYYNGTRRMRPRMGATASNLIGVYGHSTGPTSGNQGFTYNTSDPVSAWSSCNSGTDCILWGFVKWVANIERIQSINTGTHTITTTCGSNCPSSGGPGPPYQNGYRYILENFKEGLAYGGQWYLDRSTNPWVLSYVAKSGENPNTDTVVVGSNAQVITASDLAWTTFTGLNFQNDNWTVPATGYLSKQNDPNLTNAMVSCANCTNDHFDDDTFSQTTTVGMVYSGNSSNDTLNGNIFTDTGAYALRIGLAPITTGSSTDSQVPRSITVSQNWVEGTARFFPSGSNVMIGLANTITLTNNDIGYGYHDGLEICLPGQPSSNLCASTPSNSGSHGDFSLTVTGNDFHNIAQGVTTDLGCVYAMTSYSATAGSATGNVLSGNRCHDVNSSAVNGDTADPGGHGFYLDGNTGLWTVTNNLVYRVTGMLLNQNFGPAVASQGNTIKNNIFANSANYPTGLGACVRVQNPLNTVLEFTYQSNICSMDKATSATANGQKGPPTSSSSSFQKFVSDLYSFAGTPKFSVVGNSGVTFANWKATYGEDTAGTISTSPGFTASTPCTNTVPQPGVCDDFTFTNGTGPGFGFVAFTETFGPTVRISIPTVADTFPIATLPVTSF